MTEGAPGTPRQRNGLVALLLAACLFVLYQANWSVLDEGDSVPSSVMPYALLSTGRISFDPETFPELFKWRSSPPLVEKDDFFFVSWQERFGVNSAREWRRAGNLSFNGPRYYVVESTRRHTYVSTFGPIPGLALLPVALPFYLFDHDVAYKVALRTSIAKLGSSAMVATCAALLFLIALRFTSRRRALLIAVTYGLGTCAWAVSSQNAWQQTLNQLFLTLGAAFFLVGRDRPRTAFLAGLAFGTATACRATSGVALVGVFVHLLLHHPKSVKAFVLGALPAPIAIFAHNLYYFESPFAFAQEVIGHRIAQEKTGSPDLWQTPFLEGAAGLLVSPSRGLLVFSPLLGASFFGIFRAFRNPELRALRPLAVSALVTMALQCKWFDWWGGWTYGYRPWLDAVPYLALFLIPVIDSVTKTRVRRIVYGGLLAWSMAVQAIAALTYDHSWNLRLIFVVRVPQERKPRGILDEADARAYAERFGGEYLGPSLCDVDLPFCRHRLWSLEDNIILYHFTHYRETRGRRLPPSWGDLGREL